MIYRIITSLDWTALFDVIYLGMEEGEQFGGSEGERIGGDEGERIGREIAGEEVSQSRQIKKTFIFLSY